MSYYHLIRKLKELRLEIERSSSVILEWRNRTMIDIVRDIHIIMRYLKGENQLWETVGDHC